MDSILKLDDMSVVLTPFNAASTGGMVAKYILLGNIAEKQGKMKDAIQYYTKGAITEDSLVTRSRATGWFRQDII